MASFNGDDYDLLFELGQELWDDDRQTTRRAIATILMNMSEAIRGQKFGWPNLPPRYRRRTYYTAAKARFDLKGMKGSGWDGDDGHA